MCFFCLQVPKSIFFLANADILICFAMQNPSVIQKLLPRLQIKDMILSCGRTILSSVPFFCSSREDVFPAVGDTSESSCVVGDCLTGLISESRRCQGLNRAKGLAVQVDTVLLLTGASRCTVSIRAPHELK